VGLPNFLAIRVASENLERLLDEIVDFLERLNIATNIKPIARKDYLKS
jgi:hypothetical protein